KKAWEASSQRQLESPITDSQARKVRRYLFSGASIASFDGQGRVVLPSFLLEYAGLEKELVVVGAGDHFEIWDAQGWQKQLDQFAKGEI
ncbi:cell division/cell wall cluster transcriptional repressor MraZ, partial [Patescibacteria group bacterium]|nr:cell division/cell wall cluster transcriptional repressor MraZ [Patescibacteria group bacterium]